jgi:hypothetical protein
METNEVLRNNIFEIIDNQLKNNNPPQTKETYNRLRKMGYDDFQTKQMIGQCVAVELFNILKHKKPSDNNRYITHLKALPKEPFD